MVEFGGWDMPVEYSGIIDEHMTVRTAAGLFDVSHMGQIEIAGPQALEAVQHLTCNDASKLALGQIQYSALTTPGGGFVDDILTYRIADDHFMLVVNAGNIVKDFEWIQSNVRQRGGDVHVGELVLDCLIAANLTPEGDTVEGVGLGHFQALVGAAELLERDQHRGAVEHRLLLLDQAFVVQMTVAVGEHQAPSSTAGSSSRGNAGVGVPKVAPVAACRSYQPSSSIAS